MRGGLPFADYATRRVGPDESRGRAAAIVAPALPRTGTKGERDKVTGDNRMAGAAPDDASNRTRRKVVSGRV